MDSLVATDWLKDYDPLFDLFDEEMRSGANPGGSLSQQAGSTGDFFMMNDYDLNNNYYNNPYYYKQADELSLILGLEWMPACQDLNSPGSTSSSTTSTTASSTSSSSSLPSSVSAGSQQVPTTLSSTVKYDPHSHHHSNIIAATAATTTTSTPTTTTITNPTDLQFQHQQKHTVFRIQTQNGPINSHILGLTKSNLINTNCETHQTNSALKNIDSVLVNNNLIASSLIDTSVTSTPSTATAVATPTKQSADLKKKKKCLKTRGTSLLAQPASQSKQTYSNIISTSSSQPAIKQPLLTQQPTLITINRPSVANATMPSLQQQKQLLSTTTTILSSTTTKTATSSPITYSAARLTSNVNTNNISANNSAFKASKKLGHFIRMEHSYSLMC